MRAASVIWQRFKILACMKTHAQSRLRHKNARQNAKEIVAYHFGARSSENVAFTTPDEKETSALILESLGRERLSLDWQRHDRFGAEGECRKRVQPG